MSMILTNVHGESQIKSFMPILIFKQQIATLEREVFLIGVAAGYQEEVTLSLTLKLNQKGYTNS